MDREKVIEGLERVYEYIKSSNLHPSGSEKAMAMNSVKYAIDLLKEKYVETEWCERCGRVRLKSKWEGR